MIKRILLKSLLILLAFPVLSQSRTFEVVSPEGQSSVKVVGNFTIIDSDGQFWTLYDELDKGRTLLIDIFSAT